MGVPLFSNLRAHRTLGEGKFFNFINYTATSYLPALISSMVNINGYDVSTATLLLPNTSI
jgi:hypothetical protein